MKKSIETDGVNYTIRTVNGVNTTTGAIWTKEIKVFEPLDNGFNKGLAEEVYATISEHQELWDQGSWRRLLWSSELDQEEKELLKSMAAFGIDLSEPTCGTAMCFAGWVGELSGADFVYDATLIKERGNEASSHDLEYVLVSKDHPDLEDYAYLQLSEARLGPYATKKVRERGFTPNTHVLMEVSEYACMMLGIGGDPLDLFGGDNDLDGIRERIDMYTEQGKEARFKWEDEEEDDYEDVSI